MGGMGGMGGYDDEMPGPPPSSPGVLNLDYITFDKIVGSSHPVLVRFDKDYPSPAENAAFSAMGEKSLGSTLVVGAVSVSEYDEESPNRVFLDKYKLVIADMPTYMLFPANSKEGVTFSADKEDTGAIVKFIEEQGVYILLPGCLREFDQLAMQFMTKAKEQKKLLKTAEEELAKLSGDDEKAAKTYVQIMKKIIEKGDKYIETETARVEKLSMDHSVKEDKRTQFERRVNVLKSFKSGE
mmetsp:Transcript_41334/g.101462  ORF Transcript_41334/g.101462 Transcript_41334/m.101462 type:complete len:240 (-) Transcript_41334:209-928(-)